MSINKNELFNIKTMNELFKSKKIWLQNVITPKKHAFKKLGVLGIIFLFGICTFISGYNINSYAASSNTVLSVARGGTGQNNLANVMGVGSANKLANPVEIDWVPFDGTTSIQTGANWYYFRLVRDIDADDDPDFSYLKFCQQNGNSFPSGYGGFTSYLTFMNNPEASTNTGYIVEIAAKNSANTLLDGLVKKLLYKPLAAGNRHKFTPTYFMRGSTEPGCTNGNWYFRIPKIQDSSRYMFWQSSNSGDGLLTQVLDKELKSDLKDKQWNYFQQPNTVFPTPTPTDVPTPTPTPTPTETP
ncbi:MAG: hypothetical protein LBT91_01815 [Bifidobacteriaceae bacterium]|jgi:hypothetical protein|nr:hypothetical protein [Bifidobacteriaceae bacterium]